MWLILAPAAIACLGCSQTLRPEQAVEGERVDVDTFLHEHLQKQAMVTASEAYRAMMILADGKEEFDSFEAREEALKAREILRPEWELPRDACIDQGTVAYMLCRIMLIRGGVNMRVFGSLGLGDRRYAIRELVYMDLMEQGPPYRLIMGGELVDWMARADEYMAGHGIYEEEKTDIAEVLESDLMKKGTEGGEEEESDRVPEAPQ